MLSYGYGLIVSVLQREVVVVVIERALVLVLTYSSWCATLRTYC